MNAPERLPLGLVLAETWAPVPGFDGLYSVSTLGRVRSERRVVAYRGSMRTVPERILRPGIASGYQVVRLWADGIQTHASVHRLVLEAFVGPAPDGQQGAHNDGNSMNNAVTNLRWATPKQNMADRVAHGTANRGERHGMAKLTSAEVLAIRADQRTNRAIASELGIWPATVSRIKLRMDWAWL